MFIESAGSGRREPEDGRYVLLARLAMAALLFVVLVLAASAVTGHWVFSADNLRFAHRPADAPASAHQCALATTGHWSSCSTAHAQRVTRCARASHPHGAPTYDCKQPDARPVLGR
jgi:hypothetical protein